MIQSNRSLTGTALAAGVVLFGGFFLLKGSFKTYRTLEAPEINYSMPRPKNALYNFFFGLEGRDIKRTEVDPYKDRRSDTAAAGVRGDGKDAPKMDEKAKAAAAKKSMMMAAAAGRKPQTKINVVGATAQTPLTSGGLDTNPSATANTYNPAPVATATAETPKDTMSSAQWRALLSAQPTKENVAKLLKAFNEKEVDAATLYTIMNDMLENSNVTTQGLGLYLAQAVPSLKSFSAVSANYEKLNTSVQTQADTYLLTYIQKSRLSILSLALQSSETTVVSHALQVIITGIADAKATAGTGTGTGIIPAGNGTPTSTSTTGAVSTSLATYTSLVTLLQTIEKGTDTSLSTLAQNALSQIQSLSA